MIRPQLAAVILCANQCPLKGRLSIWSKELLLLPWVVQNQVDTEYMLGMLPKSDYVIVSEPEDADAVVINTCCFIDEAKRRLSIPFFSWSGKKERIRVETDCCRVSRAKICSGAVQRNTRD